MSEATAASSAVAVTRPPDLAAILVELNEVGPPSELRHHAPGLAAARLGFDRVLLTSVQTGELVPEALYVTQGRADAHIVLAQLQQQRVALDYPLLEGEIMRRRRPRLVRTAPGDSNATHAFADRLGWGDYAVAPIALDNRVVGFLHGDCAYSARALTIDDAEALGAFALVFALVYERAVLRTRLRAQRQEMRQVAAWADTRAGDLEDRLVSLEDDGEVTSRVSADGPSEAAQTVLRDLLTRREIDVLQLMVRGDTNAAIARDLVLSTGTVKFHVKNILRKLHAANRAEATSRYLRLILKH